MATLTPTLTLVSSDSSADALNATFTDTLTVTNPMTGSGTAKVLHTGPSEIIPASVSTISFVFLKNTDSTNYVEVKTAGGTAYSVLYPGEFMLLPVKGSVGIEVQANSATCVVEYGFWTRS